MSGKIAANSGFVTKAEFTRLQAKVESVLSKMAELSREVKAVHQSTTPPAVGAHRKFSGGVKSWLYSKAGSRTPRGHLGTPNDSTSCQNCGNDSSRHPTSSGAGKRISLQQINEEGPDEHRSLRNEINQFQTEAKNDIRSLQKSVKDVQELYKSLEKLVNDSIADLQRRIDRIQEQGIMNAERLDQPGLLTKMRSMAVTRDERSNCKLVNGELADDRGGYPRLKKHSTVI